MTRQQTADRGNHAAMPQARGDGIRPVGARGEHEEHRNPPERGNRGNRHPPQFLPQSDRVGTELAGDRGKTRVNHAKCVSNFERTTSLAWKEVSVWTRLIEKSLPNCSKMVG